MKQKVKTDKNRDQLLEEAFDLLCRLDDKQIQSIMEELR